jgi:membrane protease YdiL (CAAX protease family)
LILYAILITYIGITMYIANLDELERETAAKKAVSKPSSYGLPEIAAQQRMTILRWLLYGMMVMNVVYASYILQVSLLKDSLGTLPQDFNVEFPDINPLAASLNFGLSLVLSILAFRVVTSEQVRVGLKRFFGPNNLFNPASTVHMVALVLVLMLASYITGALIQEVEVTEVALSEVLFQAVLFVAAAFLGVGLAIRREGLQSLQRLGLRLPTRQDVILGVGVGLGLFGLFRLMVLIWALFVPMEQIEQQSADAILQSFGTLPMAFILSLSAAVSEEILFRGALQPVFGLLISSVLFTLLHVQYALSIGTVIILIVSLGLGWLRQRQGTTAAIIAHFVYNFVQLALAILVLEAIGGSI